MTRGSRIIKGLSFRVSRPEKNTLFEAKVGPGTFSWRTNAEIITREKEKKK